MVSKEIEAKRRERDKNAIERASLIAYQRLYARSAVDGSENKDNENSRGWPTRGL